MKKTRFLRILTIALALICVAAFWLAAVLMQPARLEAPAAQSAALAQSADEGR